MARIEQDDLERLYTIAGDELDRRFARNIVEIANLKRQSDHLWNARHDLPYIVDEGFDGIEYGREKWSVLKTLNWNSMRLAKPRKLAAVVATARNEGPYLIEWIAHQKAIGFEGLFLYTNDNTDDSLNLLERLHEAREIVLLVNSMKANAQPQVKAYEHSIHFLRELREFEWAGYFDIDEFLVPDSKFDYDVRNILSTTRERYKNVEIGAIFCHWDWYGSCGILDYQPELVQERFRVRKDYSSIKSIVNVPLVSHMYDSHIPDHDFVFLNSALVQAYTVSYQSAPIEYSGARLNHYFHKSFEEYAVKLDRGTGVDLSRDSGRRFSQFFAWEPNAHDSSELGTPEELLVRVRSEMERIRRLPGVAEAEQASISKFRALSTRLLGGDTSAAYSRVRAELGIAG